MESRGAYGGYEESEMQLALEAVQERGISVKTAAREHQVPVSSLRTRVKKLRATAADARAPQTPGAPAQPSPAPHTARRGQHSPCVDALQRALSHLMLWQDLPSEDPSLLTVPFQRPPPPAPHTVVVVVVVVVLSGGAEWWC